MNTSGWSLAIKFLTLIGSAESLVELGKLAFRLRKGGNKYSFQVNLFHDNYYIHLDYKYDIAKKLKSKKLLYDAIFCIAWKREKWSGKMWNVLLKIEFSVKSMTSATKMCVMMLSNFTI